MVYLQFRSSLEQFVTQGTLAPNINVPVPGDAVFAEVMSTWCGDWISEHIQADGAQKLIFRSQITSSKHVCTLQNKSKHFREKMCFLQMSGCDSTGLGKIFGNYLVSHLQKLTGNGIIR